MIPRPFDCNLLSFDVERPSNGSRNLSTQKSALEYCNLLRLILDDTYVYVNYDYD